MNKKKSLWVTVAVAVAVIAVVAGWQLWRSSVSRAEIKVFSDLRDVRELVLAEMSLNKVGVISDDGATGFASRLNSLKIGERIAVYSYDTYLEAYIDLSELTADDVEVDRKNRFVRLRLPAVHTRFTGRDMEVKEEHYRVAMLRSNISPGERARLKELMNTTLKAEVENNSEYRRLITDEARAKAVGFFTALLRERGYESEVTVAAN